MKAPEDDKLHQHLLALAQLPGEHIPFYDGDAGHWAALPPNNTVKAMLMISRYSCMFDPDLQPREGVMRVGDILVRMGLVSAGDVEAAVAYQKVHGIKLGTALVALELLSLDAILNALEDQRDFDIQPASDGGIVFHFPLISPRARRLAAMTL